MKYAIYNAAIPLRYSSCGSLVSDGDFLHTRRNLDSFVLILVIKGTLFLTQEDREYALKANDFMILFPHMQHFGTRPSKGELVYYWMHFYPVDDSVQIVESPWADTKEKGGKEEKNEKEERVVLPEKGTIAFAGHARLLFGQLLDIARREQYCPTCKCHFTASLLVLETATEAEGFWDFSKGDIPPRLSECVSWLHVHYNRVLSAEMIASRFQYHPAYLTQLFTRYTGYSLNQYLNRLRISAAKNLLGNPELTVETIAIQCGFRDVKYFYRIFKKEEGVTPGEYRQAFHYKRQVPE